MLRSDIAPPGGWANPAIGRGSVGSCLTATERAARQSAELKRLEDAREWDAPWRKWGPYLSERQWGTVREDYSQNGDAWEYFPHDHARSRAYHWGEDGLAGFCDLKQRLCFALALWNGKDPILKERLFGLSNRRGEPRRGREGVLLLSRFHADPLVHEVAVQVPPGRLSVRRPREDECASHAPGLRVRAHRHRRVRRRPLLRRLRRICQVVSGGMLHPDHRREPGPGDRDDSSVAHPVVPQHVELVARRRRNPTWRRRKRPTARASWRRRTRNLAIDGSTAMERRRCCSPRTTRTPSGSSTRPTRAPTSKTPFTRSSCTGTPTPSTRRRSAPRPPLTTVSRSAPASRWRSGSASPMRRRRPVRSPPSRRRSRPGVARRTSSTDPARRSPPARTPRASCGRPSAASSGRSSTTSSTSTCGSVSTA